MIELRDNNGTKILADAASNLNVSNTVSNTAVSKFGLSAIFMRGTVLLYRVVHKL